MPGVERIDSIYNIAMITGEHEQLQKILQQDAQAITTLYNNIETFQGKSNVANVAKNWDNVSVAMTGAAEASEAMIQLQAQLNAQIAKYNDLEKQYEIATKAATAANKQMATDTKAMAEAYKGVAGSIQANIRLQLEYKQQLQDLKREQKELNDGLKSTGDITGQVTTRQVALAESIAEISQASSELQRTIRLQIKEQQSASGSVDELRAQYESLYQVWRGLSQEERNSPFGQGLQTDLGTLKSEINDLQVSAGNFADNIGRYTSSFKPALAVLEQQLADIKQKFATMVPGSAGATQAGQQIELLENLIGQLSKEFTSTRGEMRAFQDAAVQLGLSLGTTDERVTAFNAAIGSVKNGIDNIKKAITAESANSKFFTGLINAATALTHTFTLAQAAFALTGDESEDSAKQMAKFQQLLVLINSLQGLSTVIKGEAGIVEAALSAKMMLTNAALKIQTLLTTEAIAAVTAKVEAETADVAAQEGQAAAAAEVTAATEAETAATVEATVATTGLTTAIAIGLGGAIIAIGALIVWLVSKIPGWVQGTALTMKQQKALADAMKEANQTIIDQVDLMDKLDSSQRKYYTAALSNASALGENQYKQLALEKNLAAVTRDSAKERIDELGANNNQQRDLHSTMLQLENQRKEYTDVLQKLGSKPNKDLTSDDKRNIDAANANIELVDKRITAVKGLYDAGEKARQDYFDSINKMDDVQAKIEKLAADERRQYILESTKVTAEGIKDINDKILNDERSTLDQRLKAIQSNAKQERIIAQAAYTSVITNNSSTDTQKAEAAVVLGGSLRQTNRNEQTQLRNTRYEYYVRDRNAALEIFKLEQEDRQNNAQKTLEDDKSTFAERQRAQFDNYEAQRLKLGAQFLQDQEALGLTNKEKLKLAQQYNSDLLKLNIDYDKQQDDEQKKEHERQLQQQEQFYQKQKDQLTKNQAAADINLNNQYQDKKIGTGTFEARRRQQEYENQVANAGQGVKEAFGNVLITKEGTKERESAEAQLAKAQMDLSDLVTQHQLDNQKKVEELQLQSYESVAHTIVSLFDGAYERQLNNIQKTIDKNNKYKENETARIAASTLGEQQKAAAIDVLTRQTEANNEALARRQRDIKVKQARFDRDVAVAETIEQGAVAAIAALKIPVYGEVEAIAIGIITAAKVAEILARPLPTYGFGTEDHPGGAAWVGDRYQKELIKEPGRSAYWSPAVPTILDLPKHTQVIPGEEIDRMISDNMYVNSRGILMMQKSKDDSRKIMEAIIWQTGRLEKAVKSQKPAKVNVHVHGNWNAYIEKSV